MDVGAVQASLYTFPRHPERSSQSAPFFSSAPSVLPLPASFASHLSLTRSLLSSTPSRVLVRPTLPPVSSWAAGKRGNQSCNCTWPDHPIFSSSLIPRFIPHEHVLTPAELTLTPRDRYKWTPYFRSLQPPALRRELNATVASFPFFRSSLGWLMRVDYAVVSMDFVPAWCCYAARAVWGCKVFGDFKSVQEIRLRC